MTVGTTLRGWSATAANNSPKGTDVIGTSADDELRQIQATVRQYLASQSSTVTPSAGIADLTTATGHWVPVSGSSTITGLGSEDAGIEYILNFTGTPILVHSTALQLPGQATITAGTLDACVAESLGSGNWKIWGYSPYNSPPANGTVLAVEQASSSGTSIDFTGIPSWVKRITITFEEVTTSGTSTLLVQVGDSGGIESTGYISSSAKLADSGTLLVGNSTAGYVINQTAANFIFSGHMVLTLSDATNNTWIASHYGKLNTLNCATGGGSKSLSATLDRVRVTTTNGTDTFDAGAINVLYE